MDKQELKERTKKFAIKIIDFIENLPKTKTLDIIVKQLLRSSTAIGANYRAACKAQSHSHFIFKIGIVEEETDETIYWLELINELDNINNKSILQDLLKEAKELNAIFTTSSITARKNKSKK